MDARKLKVLLGIFVVLTVLDWILGSLIVRDMLPAWAMLLANPPFGYVYVYTESLWMSGNYVLNGQIIGEGYVNHLQLVAHLAQISLYFVVWWFWDWLRQLSKTRVRQAQLS